MRCPKCAVGFLFGNVAYDLGYIYTCDSCGYCEIKNQVRPPEPFIPQIVPQTFFLLDWLKPKILPPRIADDEIDDLGDEIEGE